MNRTTRLALTGLFAALALSACRKSDEPTEMPSAPVAKIEPSEPKAPEVIDLTPPPATPPAENAVPANEDPSVPDTEAAP